jgi:RNA polymerase sigma-70 factor, ECF subfamily
MSELRSRRQTVPSVLLRRAQEGDEDAFREVIEPHQRELHAHCYRMLGSVYDAEDALQDAMLRAWRGLARFGGRASLRSWLYTIATNACLDQLGRRAKRVLPMDFGAATDPQIAPGEPIAETTWLEPYPDQAFGLEDGYSAPEARYERRESVELAFVAALQHLPANQRAVLLLREVLGFSARETAEMLDTTVASVNSALQRGRAQLAKHRLSQPVTPADDERSRELLAKYMAAFEAYDVTRIVALLAEDAVWEMPPFTGWYQGSADIGRLIAERCPAKSAGDMRLVATSANGQPVFAVYMRGEDDVFRAFQLQQLTLSEAGVAHVACYFDTELFEVFGLPEVWRDSLRA